jgi:hypothetical protein
MKARGESPEEIAASLNVTIEEVVAMAREVDEEITRLVEEAPVEVQCCFCGAGVERLGVDPCALRIVNHWDRPEDEQRSQTFYCHAACLRSRMQGQAAFNASTLDPSFEDE